MEVRTVSPDQIPKRTIKRPKSKFEASEVWKQIRARLKHPLRKTEVAVFTFTKGDWKETGLSSEPEKTRRYATGCRSVKLAIVKYLKAKGRKYNIRIEHDNENGADHIVVNAPKYKIKAKK